jgi:carbon monoxide dehydrogenase subunit G
MLVKETFRVKAPIQRVWQFLIDPEKIGSCIPGCEKIEISGGNAYTCTITIKLPIISITVESTTTISEITPPHHLKSVTEGKYDIGNGSFRQESIFDLKELSDGEVEVSYSADTKLVGGLAGFGETIMNSMAKGMVEQFTKNIRSKLEGEKGGSSFEEV